MKPIVSTPVDSAELAEYQAHVPAPLVPHEVVQRRKRLHYAGAYAAAGVLAGARALYLLENGEIMAWLLASFALVTWSYLTWRIG